MIQSVQPLPLGSTIGIIGGGQLGRMLCSAAIELGYVPHIYTPEVDSPASAIAATTVAAYEDSKALENFARSVTVVTYEFENIPLAAVEALGKLAPVYPSPQLLAISQHRVQEKQSINALGIATAPFEPVQSLEALRRAADTLGLPAVLKTSRMGYDGKGQITLQPGDDLSNAWQALGSDDAILEGFIAFRMEISVIIARDRQGTMSCYPPVQNIHKHHILHETIAPAQLTPALAEKAQCIAECIAQALNLVGILAVEMFVTADDTILVNELAPRPHNSGHWTMDACVTSQFEQAIRAICGLPLGSAASLCQARMLNLIGDDIHGWQEHAAQPNAKLHLYGKKEARPGRKMGHVTFLESAISPLPK